MKEWSDLDRFADELGFVVAYPDAVAGWGEGCDCTTADGMGVDDVEFTRFLVRYISRTWAVDRDRVYATGFSAGGAMSMRLACEIDSPVRGVATVGMTMRKTLPAFCDPPGSDPAPLPVLVMLGADDPFVPPEGREDLLSLTETRDIFRRLDGCSGQATISFQPTDPAASPRIRREEYRECSGASRVRIDLVDGLGHAWPRDHTNPSGIDASRIVAEFLLGRP
jgi:polyhydroxybutyrate depolymerase